LSKNAETASTTRTNARLMTATVLALTAMHAALPASSLDHLVGERQEIIRNFDAKRFCSLEVDH
jgi:hypothetical protein